MKQNKHKYQEEYENTTGLFWGNKPAKYVRLFAETISPTLTELVVLDLGAGEGKNSVYLAKMGCNVTAVDISEIALSKFYLQDDYEIYKNKINKINCNILDSAFEDLQFDIIVAYGIFHCLSSQMEIERFVEKVKKWTKTGGYFIGATFTDEIPPPVVQEYLEFESFLPFGSFEKLFSNWKIICTEDEIITETHPTSRVSHQHSITRLIAQKS